MYYIGSYVIHKYCHALRHPGHFHVLHKNCYVIHDGENYWGLLGQTSAGKVVQALEAVAWQAPVGPSDDGFRGSMDASAPDERKTPVTGVLIFVGRAERPGVRHQDRCATVCAQTSAGKAPPARSATVTDRAATRLSRRAVAAGKQRRGRAARPPHPCRRCRLLLHYFDPVSILPEFCT